MNRITLSLLAMSMFLPILVQAQVIVSIPPQKQFIQQIAGERVQVDVMLTPGDSPETFSPSPRQLAMLTNARAYIHIGVPFERHWTSSLQALNPDMKVMSCCEQFSAIFNYLTKGDVHYWTDPEFVLQYLDSILMVLVDLQPENKALFQSNLDTYKESIRQLNYNIVARLNNRKLDHFIITHSALDAYADRYGLVQLSIEQSGRESGPKKLLSIIETATHMKIETIFDLEQYHTRTVTNLANQLGAQIISINPLAEDYLANMYEITEQLAKALGQKE